MCAHAMRLLCGASEFAAAGIRAGVSVRHPCQKSTFRPVPRRVLYGSRPCILRRQDARGAPEPLPCSFSFSAFWCLPCVWLSRLPGRWRLPFAGGYAGRCACAAAGRGAPLAQHPKASTFIIFRRLLESCGRVSTARPSDHFKPTARPTPRPRRRAQEGRARTRDTRRCVGVRAFVPTIA